MAKNSFSEGRGPSQRQLRVGELIRRTLSEVLVRDELHDPDITRMSITVGEVRITPDLSIATCFVLPLGGKNKDENNGRRKRNPIYSLKKRYLSSTNEKTFALDEFGTYRVYPVHLLI